MTQNWASYFDHTLLKQSATEKEIEQLCSEASEFGFFSVCVNPFWLPLCKKLLLGSSTKLCTVVGFPLGANSTKLKQTETELSLKEGAQEIDCVINVGALKSGRFKDVEQDLAAIVSICSKLALVKVIVESGVLSNTELETAIKIVNSSGAEFIKTSTGFASTGATNEAVIQMKKLGRPGLKIKASGGIKTGNDFKNYVALGANRIGASQSVTILKELEG